MRSPVSCVHFPSVKRPTFVKEAYHSPFEESLLWLVLLGLFISDMLVRPLDLVPKSAAQS
jgi:hypothetical protein